MELALQTDEKYIDMKPKEQTAVSKNFEKEQPNILVFLAVMKETMDEDLWNALCYATLVIWQVYREAADGKLATVSEESMEKMMEEEYQMLEIMEKVLDVGTEEEMIKTAEKFIQEMELARGKSDEELEKLMKNGKISEIFKTLIPFYTIVPAQEGLDKYFENFIRPEMLDDGFNPEDTDYLIAQLSRISNIFDKILNPQN